MELESRRDLQLLEALEQESTITQRTLSSRLGMALGLTNLYLKRLIRKGYVKCVTVSPNRLVYALTPKGVARKGRLTYEFMKYSLDFYRDARQHLRASLSRAVAQRQHVAIYGTGDAAELVYLLVRDMGLQLVAVFSPEPTEHFLGVRVLPIAEHATVAYDVLVVAVLERPAGTAKLLRQCGVPDEKVLMLRPDWPGPKGGAVSASNGREPGAEEGHGD
jgi:DNA-binding MarR family transcriptional regulator